MGQRLFSRYSGRKPDTVMMKSKTLSAKSLTSLSCFHAGFHSLYFTAVLTLARSLRLFFLDTRVTFKTQLYPSFAFINLFLLLLFSPLSIHFVGLPFPSPCENPLSIERIDDSSSSVPYLHLVFS